MSIIDNIKIVPAIQCEVPRTSIQKYITGMYALNVPAPEGTSGDWHDVFFWRDGIDEPCAVDLAGDGAEWNTNPVFGDYGVYEGKDRLEGKGLYVGEDIAEVYIANHFRAILDLLYQSLKKYEVVLNLTGATDDWLDTPEQKALLLSKARLLEDAFTGRARRSLAAWIESESGLDWRTI
jgi:hypothetical protein